MNKAYLYQIRTELQRKLLEKLRKSLRKCEKQARKLVNASKVLSLLRIVKLPPFSFKSENPASKTVSPPAKT